MQPELPADLQLNHGYSSSNTADHYEEKYLNANINYNSNPVSQRDMETKKDTSLVGKEK